MCRFLGDAVRRTASRGCGQSLFAFGITLEFFAQVDERGIGFQIFLERVANGVAYDEEDDVLVRKSDFALGGMHVHVKIRIGHVEEEDGNGLDLRSVGLVGLRDRLRNHLAFDRPVAQE